MLISQRQLEKLPPVVKEKDYPLEDVEGFQNLSTAELWHEWAVFREDSLAKIELDHYKRC